MSPPRVSVVHGGDRLGPMTRAPRTALAFLLALLSGACPQGAQFGVDAGASTADGGLPACPAPSGLSRGRAWTRANPPFVSALSVVMGTPSRAAVEDYFGAFHATAAHLWTNGLPDEAKGWAASGAQPLRFVSWVQPDGTSSADGAVLGGAAGLPGRIGYQVGDEPMDLAELRAMGRGAAVVRAADPEALVVLNLAPGIGGADAILAEAAGMEEVDVLSMDFYSYGDDAYAMAAKVRQAALAGGKAYWRYLDGFRYASEGDPATESDLRWDAHLGATLGYTGHTWFLYQIEPTNPDLRPLFFEAMGDYGSPRAPPFAWAARVNLELANLGRTLSLLRSVDARYAAAGGTPGPAGVAAWAAGAGGEPFLQTVAPVGAPARDALVGLFRDDCDEPYVMVQNAAHAAGAPPNDGGGSATFRLGFDFSSSGAEDLDRTAVLVLDPATGAIEERPLDAAALELTLPAGGAALFKYKDGRGFARQP